MAVPAFAAPEPVPDKQIDGVGGSASAEVLLTAEASNFNVTVPMYIPVHVNEKANASAFDGAYTTEAYDALRQCMADGQSVPITMSAETRAAMQKLTATIGSYPSYTLKAQRHGTALFQKNCSTSYKEAAEAARAIIDGLAGKTDSEKLFAFACSVCDRLEYDEGSTATPCALFATDGVKKGNCMSYTHGFQFLCNLADIPCILVHSDVHQWNEVYTNGRWYSVDLTGFKIGYSERGSATLLHDSSELIGSMYTQSEPQLALCQGTVCTELYQITTSTEKPSLAERWLFSCHSIKEGELYENKTAFCQEGACPVSRALYAAFPPVRRRVGGFY